MVKFEEIDFRYINAEFIMTNACNLRCEYCFERTRIKQDCIIENLSYEKITEYMELILQNRRERKLLPCVKSQINFFGGEPMICWPTIKKVIQEYSRYPFFDFSIITNGTLVTEEILDKMSHYPILWQYSLDSSNPKGNVLRFGEGATEKTNHVLKMIEKTTKLRYPYPIISSVINSISVPYLAETYDYFFEREIPVRWQIMPERLGVQSEFIELYQKQNEEIFEKVCASGFNIPMLWKNTIDYVRGMKKGFQGVKLSKALSEAPSPNNVYIVGQNGKLYLTTNHLNSFDSDPHFTAIGDSTGIDVEKIKDHPMLRDLAPNTECQTCPCYLLNPCCVEKKYMVYPSLFKGNCMAFQSSTYFGMEYLKRKGEI